MISSIQAKLVGLAVLLSILFAQPALAQRSPEATVGRSLQTLSEITRNPKTGMPRLVLRKAAGIAIIPDMFKASFVFGARFGKGVLVVKQPDGTWSNPVFIHIFGGSFGAQAGAQSDRPRAGLPDPEGAEHVPQGQRQAHAGCRYRVPPPGPWASSLKRVPTWG